MPTPANILYNTRYEVKTALPLEFFAEHEKELIQWVLDLATKFDPAVDPNASNLCWRIPQRIDSASWTGAKPRTVSTPVIELMAYREYDPKAHEVSWVITYATVRDRDAIHDWLTQSPYIWSQSQPQTLEQLYGLHRRTAAQVYGSPAGAPGLSPRGATSSAPVAVSYPGRSPAAGKARAKGPSSDLTQLLSTLESDMQKVLWLGDKPSYYHIKHQWEKLKLQLLSPTIGQQLSYNGLEENIKPIPHEGLKPGEVIAWRAWIVGPRVAHKDPCLYSTAMSEFVWLPGEVVKGDPGTHGIHAFKNLGNLLSYMSSYNNSHLAIGKVALWGEIVEHELGYRAEFAKVYEICDIVGQTARTYDPSRDEMSSGIGPVKGIDLTALRKLYNVEDRK